MGMDPLFQVRRLNNAGQGKAGSIAKGFNNLLLKLRKHIKPCRELAICEMKLEEACVFAKKGIAIDPDNHYVTKKQQKLERHKS